MVSFFDMLAFRGINFYARAPFLDVMLPLFSEAWLLWVGLAVFLVCFEVYCQRRYGESLWRVLVLVIFLALSVGVADFSCNLIKNAVGKHRPFQTVEGTHLFTSDREWVVVDEPTFSPQSRGGSFPSAHAANSMAVALIISLLFRQANPWIFAMPFMVGWSRVYVGKHFPVDVLMGWLVGLFAVLAVWWFCHLLFARFSRDRRPSLSGKSPQG